MHWGVDLQDFRVLYSLTPKDGLDLKCSQRQKCKYLWSPLFSCHMCIRFSVLRLLLWVVIQYFIFLYLVYIWFLYFVIIIFFISLSYLKKKKNTHVFLYFRYTIMFSYTPIVLFKYDHHESKINCCLASLGDDGKSSRI